MSTATGLLVFKQDGIVMSLKIYHGGPRYGWRALIFGGLTINGITGRVNETR